MGHLSLQKIILHIYGSPLLAFYHSLDVGFPSLLFVRHAEKNGASFPLAKNVFVQQSQLHLKFKSTFLVLYANGLQLAPG